MRPGSYSSGGFACSDRVGEDTHRGSAPTAAASRAGTRLGATRSSTCRSQPVSAGTTPTRRHWQHHGGPAALVDTTGLDAAVLPQFLGYSKTGHPQNQAHAPHAYNNNTLYNRSSTTTVDDVFGLSKRRSLDGNTGSSSWLCASGIEPAVETHDHTVFSSKRRLPSILLDSWELRKIAPEGSVLPNALVSWDVDGDGVEEILLGTTEGHFFILKPDCRVPVYAYTVSATISVVLYSEQLRRLILITLEGQCEVFDDFPMPPAANVGSNRTRHGNSGGSGGGGGNTNGVRAGGTASATASSGAPSSAVGDDDTAPRNATSSSAAASARAALLRSKRMPHQDSVASLGASVEGTGSYVDSRHSIPSSVFHVASNCLCADMGTETDHRSLLFLGSFDNRLYVYSIDDGVCLLSLFMHQPITCLKTFSLPCQVPLPPTPILTPEEDEVVNADEAAPSVARLNVETPLDRTKPSKSTPVEVPLIAVTTSTSVVLLPAYHAELQRWRRQEKRTGRPLTLADGDTIRHYHDVVRLRRKAAARTSASAATDTTRAKDAGNRTDDEGAPSVDKASLSEGVRRHKAGGTVETAAAPMLASGTASSTASLTAGTGVPTTDSHALPSLLLSTTTDPQSVSDVHDHADLSVSSGHVRGGDAEVVPYTTACHTASASPHTKAASTSPAEVAAADSEALMKAFTRPPMTLLQPLWFARLGREVLSVPPALTSEDMASGKFGVLNAAKRQRGRAARPTTVFSTHAAAAPSDTPLSCVNPQTAEDGVEPDTMSHQWASASASAAVTSHPQRAGGVTAGSAAARSAAARLLESDEKQDASSWLPVSVDVSVGGKRAMMILSSEDGRAYVVSLTPFMENGELSLVSSPPSQGPRVVPTGRGDEGTQAGARTDVTVAASLQRPLTRSLPGGRRAPCVDVRQDQPPAGATLILRSRRDCPISSPLAAGGRSAAISKPRGFDHASPLSLESATSLDGDGTDASSSDDGSHYSDSGARAGGHLSPAPIITHIQGYQDISLPLPPTVRQLQKQQRPSPRPISHHPHRTTAGTDMPTTSFDFSKDGTAKGCVGTVASSTAATGSFTGVSVGPTLPDWAEGGSPCSNVSPSSPMSPANNTVNASWPLVPAVARPRTKSSGNHTHSVGASTPSPAVPELTLRLQCEWSAHLGTMPLVQRARIFVTEGEDTFTVVLVAANGRCYSFDPDSAAAVECTVKADCSSFTLVAGNSCSTDAAACHALASTNRATSSSSALPDHTGSRTTSGLGPRWNSETLGRQSPPGLGGRHGGLYVSQTTGEVRPVFCVCVSVDELCLYSVGEAHNTSAIPFSVSHSPPTAVSLTKDGGGAQSTAGAQAAPRVGEPTLATATVKAGVADIFEGGAVCDGMGHFTDVQDERELLLELGHALIEAGGGEAPDNVKAAVTETERDERIIWMVRQVLTRDHSAADWHLLQQLATNDAL